MQQGPSKREAVRLAKEKLGDVPSTELAAYIQETFGLTIQPITVTVLLGSLLERAILERSSQAIQEQIERWKAENPREARKLAAAAKRREATAIRKAEAKRLAQESQQAAATPPPTGEIGLPVRAGELLAGGAAGSQGPAVDSSALLQPSDGILTTSMPSRIATPDVRRDLRNRYADLCTGEYRT
jgi:hypothetical protein